MGAFELFREVHGEGEHSNSVLGAIIPFAYVHRVFDFFDTYFIDGNVSLIHTTLDINHWRG